MNKSNQVKIYGKLKNGFIYDHAEDEKSICKAELDISRKRHRYPLIISIMIPAEMIEANEVYTDQTVMVKGGLRSFDAAEEEAHDQGVYIMADEIEIAESQERPVNEVYLRGVLCKRPLTKIVSHDNLVTKFLLATNYHGQTVYVPCSVGDLMAMDVAMMEVDTEIEISGRVHVRQSKISVWVNPDRECLRRM